MMIGIEKMSFFTPPFYIEMDQLAHARDTDPNKYKIGLGQDQMSLAPVHYDSVALAINAGLRLELTQDDKDAIDTVILATESGVDYSKAGSTWVQRLLDLPHTVRAIEMKQACYSATAALKLAMGHVALHPEKKVLIIASDVANYGARTPGEPTQGAGAVAMLLSSEPQILALEKDSAPYTEEISDFWRPNYSDVPFVHGKYSNQAYLNALRGSWSAYQELTGREASDFDALLFHVPYTKMGRKALDMLEDLTDLTPELKDEFMAHYEKAIVYNRRVGNLYTGSLYLSLVSLLEQTETLEGGDKIGLFSYGSGAVGEFFAAKVLPNFKDHLQKSANEALLDERFVLDIPTYEDVLAERATVDADGNWEADNSLGRPGDVMLTGIEEHVRQYDRV